MLGAPGAGIVPSKSPICYSCTLSNSASQKTFTSFLLGLCLSAMLAAGLGHGYTFQMGKHLSNPGDLFLGILYVLVFIPSEGLAVTKLQREAQT